MAPKLEAAAPPKPRDKTEDYGRSVAMLEYDEARMWHAVRELEEDDASKGAKALRSQHRRAMNEILREHASRMREMAPEDRSRRKFVSSPPPKARVYRIISNRTRKESVEKVEMHLLPSLGYKTREDAETELWNFKKACPNLEVRLV